jgi:septum formation protein
MERLGVPFQIHVADVDESGQPGERPQDLVARLGRAKAAHVSAAHPAAIVVGADTIVVQDGAILGKPDGPETAIAMLARLRDRPHQVYSGVSLVSPAHPAGETAVVESTVWMRPYGDDEIERYVAGGSPLDKAGAYGIQDADMRPVARLEGCYASVMGLPLCALGELLQRKGVELPDLPAACTAVTGAPCCGGRRAVLRFDQEGES